MFDRAPLAVHLLTDLTASSLKAKAYGAPKRPSTIDSHLESVTQSMSTG